MSKSPFSNTIYKIHSSINKNGELYIFLVNMKQPFSTQNIQSLHEKNPLFLFEKTNEIKLVNDLKKYSHPHPSVVFENKEMYTHTNYILKQICEEKDIEIIENMKERQKTIITKISNEYKKNIVKELDNFIKIMNYYNMNIIQFIDLHIEFYDPVKTVFCC